MKLLKEPVLSLPKDFEKYDAKVTDRTRLSAEGITGSMIYDILIVPRNKGEYTIPPIDFVYFDIASSSYKTLKTQPLTIKVEQGSGNREGVTDYSQRSDTDIHEFSKGLTDKENAEDTFFASPVYWVAHSIVITLFALLVWLFRKRARALADISGMREKKANKVAAKRLKKADKLMKQGKAGEFYDEVMRALWGFVADKFNMQVEELTRDNITEKLTSRNVDETVINDLIAALDDCEYARYAPGDPEGNMQRTYDKAFSILTKINK